MPEEDPIDRCVSICERMISELEGLKPNARRGQYDRQSTRQIDYAVRAVRRCADRMRALKGVAGPPGR